MKIQSYIPVEENTIGEFKNIQSGIKSTDLGFALNAVSKNLYSNPIGSFIRELVSNAVDANKENNSDKPVLVKIYKENDLWYFSVKDYGKGMSEEHFSQVYMNWFNSDKRLSNNLIGGWGIGSKSPLSYVNSYELITINDNIEYNYIIYKSSTTPTATLTNKISKENQTGTLVKFEIKEDDLWKIHTECNKQLLYFDNVIVENSKWYYDNTFNILETETFKYRTNNTDTKLLHISLGNVPYEIDFKILNITPIYLPLAIKFNTGELPVVLSRESLNYEDENINVIEVIKDKINLVLDDIKERYYNQTRFDNFNNYFEYLYTDKFKLKLEEYTISLDKEIVKAIKGNLIFKNIEIILSRDTINNLSEIIYSMGIVKSVKPFYENLHKLKLVEKVIKDSKTNKISEEYYKGKKYIKINEYSKEILLKIGKELKLKENNLIISSYIYKSIVKYIKEITTNYYSNVPEYYKQKTVKQKEVKEDYITIYNSSNIRNTLEIENLTKYKLIFYIIKNEETDYIKVANYEVLFNTFPKYFKDSMLFIFVPNSTINKFNKDKRFRPIEQIWGYTKLRNHYNRLLIRREIEILNIPYSVDYISKHYSIKRNELIKEYNYNLTDTKEVYSNSSKRTYTKDINIIEYFKLYFNNRRNNKVYKFYDNIEELYKVKDFLITFDILYRHGENRIAIQYLIKNSKLIKINRNYGKKTN